MHIYGEYIPKFYYDLWNTLLEDRTAFTEKKEIGKEDRQIKSWSTHMNFKTLDTEEESSLVDLD